MNISVVGLGLIGASFCRAIKKNTSHTVIGFDIDTAVTNVAAKDGVIDRIGSDADLLVTDLTIVALYPQAAEDFICSRAGSFKKGSIVIDTCGIKRQICEKLDPFCAENGFHFIGAHPMAGKETSGYHASTPDLFENAYMIFTPKQPDDPNMSVLTELANALGFRNVTITTPEEHDRIIAYTSQLPHVLACAYISDPDAKLHTGFSAGSYKDVSRVAKINAGLWTELFLCNKDYLSGHIKLLIENLLKLDACIETGDQDTLFNMLQHANEVKNRIG